MNSQRRISSSRIPPSARTVKVPGSSGNGPDSAEEPGRDGDHPALAAAHAEHLALLQHRADRGERHAEPFGDVGHGEPLPDEVVEVGFHGVGSVTVGSHGSRLPAHGAQRKLHRCKSICVDGRLVYLHSGHSSHMPHLTPLTCCGAPPSPCVLWRKDPEHERRHQSAPPPSVAAASPTSSVVASAHPAPYGWQTHVVRPGDTLSDLAIAHRTTVGTLVGAQPAHRRRLVPAPGPAAVGAAHHVARRRTRPAREAPALDGVHRAPRRHRRRDRAAAGHLRVRHPRGQRAAAHLGDPARASGCGCPAKAVRAARAAAAPAMSTHAGAGAPRRHRRRHRPAARRDAGLDPQGQRALRPARSSTPASVPADPGGPLADRRPHHLRRAHVLQRGGAAPRGVNRRLPGRRAPVPGRSATRRDDRRHRPPPRRRPRASPWPSPGRSRPGASARCRWPTRSASCR